MAAVMMVSSRKAWSRWSAARRAAWSSLLARRGRPRQARKRSSVAGSESRLRVAPAVRRAASIKHIAAVLARHIFNEPTQLVDAAETANIPPGVAAVIESALRKDPAQRPQTMLEFAEALRAAAADAAPSWTPRRHRLPALWLAAGLGIVVILLGIQISSPTAMPREDNMTPPVTGDLAPVIPASATPSSRESLAAAALNGPQILPMTRAEPPLAAEPELPLAAEPEPAAVTPLADPPHLAEKAQSGLRADPTPFRPSRSESWMFSVAPTRRPAASNSSRSP